MALFSADDITYPPLDVPKPVADGVWIVDSGPLRVFGLLGLPIRMTALQLSSGDMLMHSPTRFRRGPTLTAIADLLANRFVADRAHIASEAEALLRDLAAKRMVEL